MSLNVKLIQTTLEDTEILIKLFKAAFHADFGLDGPLSLNGGLIGYNSVKSQL